MCHCACTYVLMCLPRQGYMHVVYCIGEFSSTKLDPRCNNLLLMEYHSVSILLLYFRIINHPVWTRYWTVLRTKWARWFKAKIQVFTRYRACMISYICIHYESQQAYIQCTHFFIYYTCIQTVNSWMHACPRRSTHLSCCVLFWPHWQSLGRDIRSWFRWYNYASPR